jgi:hypothetical protein
MAKIFQVRYTVGDKTVAHEHYTEKGARSDAKALSKAIGNSVLGEIDIGEDNTITLVRTWEFAGGEIGKPIKREGPPSEVEVIKSADETKLPETATTTRTKSPKLSDEEKIAAKKKEYEDGLAAIAAGTYVIPTRGRKSATGEKKAPKVETNKISKYMEVLGCSEEAARILASANVTSESKRAKIALAIINSHGPILASEVVSQFNAKEEDKVDIPFVVRNAAALNYLFSRVNEQWRITFKDHGDGDKKMNLVAVKVEYQDEEEPPANAATAA